MNRAGIEWGFGTRCTIGVALPLVVASVTGWRAQGVAAALGALSVAFAGRQGVYRTRAAGMLFTTAAMAFAAFVASLYGANTLASVAIAVIWGFGYGVVASLGPTATTIATNSVVALALFGQFHLTAQQSALEALYVATGGVLQTLLLVSLWPFERFSAERKILASAFRSLAAYAAQIPTLRLHAPAPETFAKLTDTFADTQPFAARGELAAFEILYDEVERIRATLGALAAAKHALHPRGDSTNAGAIERVGAGAAIVMRAIAQALDDARAPADEAVWKTFDTPLAVLTENANDVLVRLIYEDCEALLGQLRSAWRAAGAPADDLDASVSKRAPRTFRGSEIGEALDTLRANCSPRSQYAQHGIRLAIVFGLALLAEHLLPLQRAYWILLTAALVLRPDFTTTMVRGVARIVGTLAGALVASAIAALHPHDVALLGLAIAFAFAGYVIFNVNYAAYTLTITAYVVFLLAFGGSSEETALVDRTVATLLGGTLSLVAYAAWPTWERRLLPIRLAELLDALRAYAAVLLQAYLNPQEMTAAAIHDAQMQAWLARSNAEASFDRMVAEPVQPDVVTIRSALGVLAATRRIGLALLSLNAHRSPDPIFGREPFERLTLASDASFASLAQSLRTRRPPAALPPLRALHGVFAAALVSDGRLQTAVASTETDLMVDSLNAIARILTRLYARNTTTV